MGIFKKLLDDLKNRDTETLDLLHTVSARIDEINDEEFDSLLLEGVEFEIKEQLIFGYSVLYQYRQKMILEKDIDGNDVQSTISELYIISVTEPLSQRVVNNSDIKGTIKSKILEMKGR